MPSNEMFVLRNGQKRDAELHAELLDNEDAAKASANQAIKRAVKQGMSRADAEWLYRHRATTE